MHSEGGSSGGTFEQLKEGAAQMGSAVVDADNVSGLGTLDEPAMVAIYTSFSPETKI